MRHPFRVQGDHFGIDLPGAHVLFTTRRGGVSEGPFASLNLGRTTGAEDEPDDLRAVEQNRRRIAGLAGVAPDRIARSRQVHGATVRSHADPPSLGPGETPEDEADGQVVAADGAAAMVLVADCLPVAVASPGAAGVLHGGWRGLAGGIVAEGVNAVRSASRDDGAIHAAIGPGIGPCCYEVGDEVHEVFSRFGDRVRDGRRLDLKAVARAQLEEAGVGEIHDVGLCTCCGDPDLFFSHRRDGGVTGRQAGVAWLS